ncbi:solute carrier family 23 protein [Candidatus Poriferisodalis sp.]|uniref:solute carrier family 23 protein n=1 Tax=Candidatus Poriferisodalis sp. TaxID=3101277 RepID=UPI003B02611F
MAANEHIRYEPDERAPLLLTLNTAFQGTVLIVANVTANVILFAAAFNDDGGYAEWAIVGALAVAGIVVALHASRWGRVGPGCFLLMGSGVPFLAACVLAVDTGGVALMSSLIVASSLVQLAAATWLARLRRLITPVVSGVAFMAIALSTMPIAVRRFDDVPEGTTGFAGPVVAVAVLAAIALLMLRGTGLWRLWALPLAIAVGCIAAVPLGLYDPRPLVEASWFEPPNVAGWPGFGSILSRDFWSLLPVFLVVSAVVAVRAAGEGAGIQQACRREPRTVDFRGVQQTLNVSTTGVLLSGVAGVPPTVGYLPSTVALMNFTGVAARRVGAFMGALLVGLALLPKAVAALPTVPRPVSGALLMVIMSLFFVEGMRLATRDGLTPQRALVVGLAVSIAVGLENHGGFATSSGSPWAVVLTNGVLVSVIVAIGLTALIDLTAARRRRLETALDFSSLPDLDAFLHEAGRALRWDDASIGRLRAAGEETLAAMMQLREDHDSEAPPRIVLNLRPEPGSVELEFLALFTEENLEDRIDFMGEETQMPDVSDLSFRLLRHLAAAVRHRRYYGLDVVTVTIERSTA